MKIRYKLFECCTKHDITLRFTCNEYHEQYTPFFWNWIDIKMLEHIAMDQSSSHTIHLHFGIPNCKYKHISKYYLWSCCSMLSISFTLSTICWIFLDKLSLCSSMYSNITSRCLLYVADRFFSTASCWDSSRILSCSFCNTRISKVWVKE